MSAEGEELLRDAYNVLLDAGIRPKEIIGLTLQIQFGLDHTPEERQVEIFHEQRQAKGIAHD